MDKEEGVAVPFPVVFEEVQNDQERKDRVNIAFRHSADRGSNGVVIALKEGEDINVVVEEGGSTAANGDGNYGQGEPGYTMIRHEEVKVMREELEEAKKTVEMQTIEMEKAKEMILDQQKKIAELQEDMRHEMGREGSETTAQERKKNASSSKGRIQDLEKTIEEKDEQLHQKELALLQKTAEYEIVKTMNISEVSTLKKLLSDEREKRVIAEMQVKMLLGSIENPVKYLESRSDKKTEKNLPFIRKTPPPPPVATSSKTGNSTTVDDGDDDDEVLFIEEVQNKSANGEVADADSGYPRCDSEDESEKVNDLMTQKFVCKACGLVCTTNLSLMKHIRTNHGLQLQGKSNVIKEPAKTGTPMSSGPSTSTSTPLALHNLRSRTPSKTIPINDIRRSSSSSATSSLGGNLRNDKNINEKGKGKFICTVCDDRYPIVSKLKAHMKQSHGIQDDKFSIGCKDCGIIFHTRRDHIVHRKITHGTIYNRRRSMSPSQSTGPSSSGPTLPARNDKKAPVVPVAGTSTQTLKKHAVDIKRLSEGCFCICGLEFRTTSHIKIHIKLCSKSDRILIPPPVAQNDVNRKDPGTEEEAFESKMIIDENGMRILTIQPPPKSSQQHHRIVGGDPKGFRAKYHCTCGRIYYNRASFQIHAKSKNMGKIFKCGWCTMSFDLHGNLKSHVRTYHKAIYGNGKFACGNCAHTFDNSRQLSRHRRQDCMKK